MSSTTLDDPDDRTYTVRRYRPTDREAFFSLYETVFAERPADEWFSWKYESNPYFEGVPMIVAADGDDLVGAVPLFAQRLRVGSHTVRTFQPADVMVHPDHRKRGLFTRMIEESYESFRTDEPTLLIGFPNDAALPGWLKTGWEIVETVPTYYRLQSPGSLLGLEEGAVASTVETAASSAARGYLGVRDRLADGNGSELRVERHRTIPGELLASLYRTQRPTAFHGVRDEEFYHWRFSNPNWEYATYVAVRDGAPVTAVVTGTRPDGSLTRLTELLPLQADHDAFEPLLREVLEAHAAVDVIAAPSHLELDELFRSRGFYPDTAFPLSKVSETRALIARQLTPDRDPTGPLYGTELLDGSNWQLSFAEADNS